MEKLLKSLDGGVLILKGEHESIVRANPLRIREQDTDTGDADFVLLTPNLRADFEVLAQDTPGRVEVIDITDQMPHNTNPTHPAYVKYLKKTWVNEWPTRSAPPTGITIHHTLSHSPTNTAKYICFTKGYPRTQYHYWVSQETGCPIYLCLSPTYAPYHDHCGVSPNLSIGMAGHLGYNRPPEEQLWAMVRLVAHLMDRYSLTTDQVDGHHERALLSGVDTECPGWLADTPATLPSGVWKRDFCIALQCVLDGKPWGGY